LELLVQLTLFVVVAAVAASIRGTRTRAAAIRRDRLVWELEERVKELTVLHRATSLLQEDRTLERCSVSLSRCCQQDGSFPRC
jgi:hypothetical protein